jgi:hypothetical protein
MPWTETTISTEGVTLRPFVESDKPAIVAIRTNADVYRYLGGPAGAEYAEEIRSATVGEQWGVFCIAESQTDLAIGSLHFRTWLRCARGLLRAHADALGARSGPGGGARSPGLGGKRI